MEEIILTNEKGFCEKRGLVNNERRMLMERHDTVFKKCIDALDIKGKDVIDDNVVMRLSKYEYGIDELLVLEEKIDDILTGNLTKLSNIISANELVHEYLLDKLDEVINCKWAYASKEFINRIHDREYTREEALIINLELDAVLHASKKREVKDREKNEQ